MFNKSSLWYRSERLALYISFLYKNRKTNRCFPNLFCYLLNYVLKTYGVGKSIFTHIYIQILKYILAFTRKLDSIFVTRSFFFVKINFQGLFELKLSFIEERPSNRNVDVNDEKITSWIRINFRHCFQHSIYILTTTYWLKVNTKLNGN